LKRIVAQSKFGFQVQQEANNMVQIQKKKNQQNFEPSIQIPLNLTKNQLKISFGEPIEYFQFPNIALYIDKKTTFTSCERKGSPQTTWECNFSKLKKKKRSFLVYILNVECLSHSFLA